MNIQIRVQHSAGREFPLQRLLERLPPAVEVVTDDEAFTDPNPLRNFLRCLADPQSDATHLCVIQDDALPCRDFQSRLEAAAAEKPNEVLSLFVGGLPGRTKRDFLLALKNRERWVPIHFRDMHHVVATVWPVEQAQQLLDWWASKPRIPGPEVQRADDHIVCHWIRSSYANRHRRRQVWATVPCLVEHPDDLPSVVQDRSRNLGDQGRRAIHWIDA